MLFWPSPIHRSIPEGEWWTLSVLFVCLKQHYLKVCIKTYKGMIHQCQDKMSLTMMMYDVFTLYSTNSDKYMSTMHRYIIIYINVCQSNNNINDIGISMLMLLPFLQYRYRPVKTSTNMAMLVKQPIWQCKYHCHVIKTRGPHLAVYFFLLKIPVVFCVLYILWTISDHCFFLDSIITTGMSYYCKNNCQ